MLTPSVPLSDGRKALPECTLALAVCVFVSALAILPFFRIGEVPGSGCCGGAMPVTHDMAMHLNQMQSFYEGLAAGRLYPRWNAQTNRGFGAPTTIFYPPLTYYITSFLYFVTGRWMAVIALYYLLAMIASGMAFFSLVRILYDKWPALIATALYLVMPYHLLNHYQRGALAECLSFIFIPLIALALLKLMWRELTRHGALRWAAVLSLTWGLFIWSHPPTAYQFWLIALPVLMVAGVMTKRLRGLLWIAGAVVAGTMISGAYLLPAIAERKAVHSDDVERSWPYHESYVLDFSSARYDHVHDDFVVRLDRIWTVTTILLFGAGLSLAFARRGRRVPCEDTDFRIWLGASMLATVMMLRVSSVIGVLIPQIEIGVFAWRMLALTSTGLAVLGGYLAAEALTRKGSVSTVYRRGSRVGLGVFSVVVLLGSLGYVVLPMYRAESFRPIPDHSNYSLVPAAGGREPPDRPEVLVVDGAGTFTIRTWQPEYRVIDLQMAEQGIVSLRLYNYVGWKAMERDHEVPIRTGPVGEVEVALTAGKHELVVEFQGTRVRNLGLVASVLGVMITAGMFVAGSRKRIVKASEKREE